VQLYTPVNEMYICAMFSARYGWWNEQLSSDAAFVTALKHIVKANVLAMRAILESRPDAIFVQSESSEYFHAENPPAIKPAELLNSMRFLSLDLNYGRRVDSEMYEFLLDNGMTARNIISSSTTAEAALYPRQRLLRHQRTSRGGRWLHPHVGRGVRLCRITRQYHSRYLLPVMHTETNLVRARSAPRRSTGSGRNGRMCCGSATTACRSSASPGIR
jgi:hypothetical protein